MKVIAEGKHWLKLEDYRIDKLRELLPVVEEWIALEDPRIVGANYWGICADEPTENVFVNLANGYDGVPLLVNYKDVMKQFPKLHGLFIDLELQPYLGVNKIGNWGIHRHCYNPTSRWNLVLLGEGNDGGSAEFFLHPETDLIEPDWDYVVDYMEGCEGTTVKDYFEVKDNEAYSVDTWTWHAHNCLTGNATAWLMHFKYADKKISVKRVLDKLNTWGHERIAWRFDMQSKYYYGTDKT
tara:strand:+ start:1164 stop:1880 length:717 start_codon:yes stop_codon:yes gene_type:complete